jgi:hypothetical protein
MLHCSLWSLLIVFGDSRAKRKKAGLRVAPPAAGMLPFGKILFPEGNVLLVLLDEPKGVSEKGLTLFHVCSTLIVIEPALMVYFYW